MSYPTILPRSARVLEEVSHERARQDARWGEQNHPDGTGPMKAYGFLGTAEDHALTARARCDSAHRLGEGTWEHILTEEYAEALAEEDPGKLRAELIQIAAVATAWAEAIDRRAR